MQFSDKSFHAHRKRNIYRESIWRNSWSGWSVWWRIRTSRIEFTFIRHFKIFFYLICSQISMKITRKNFTHGENFSHFPDLFTKNYLICETISALSATSRQSNGRRWSKFENLFRHTILIIIRTWNFFLCYEKWKFLFFLHHFPPLYSGNAKHFELAHTLWHDSLSHGWWWSCWWWWWPEIYF